MIDVFLDANAKRGATRHLFEQLRDGIVTGRLAVGDRLPSSRDLAIELGVSRHTVTTVYGRLTAEGYVEGRAGGGSVVSRAATASSHRRKTSALAARHALRQAAVESVDNPAPSASQFDLRSGVPDARLFPLQAWRQSVAATLHLTPPGYGDAAGAPELRRTIARWVAKSRAVDADADQIVITAGAQQAVDLVVRLLAGHGDVIAVEDPGYAPVRRLCLAAGATVVPVPVDNDGLRVDLLPVKARIVYTTPSHQSPTGVTMSLARRRELLAIAERHNIAIIEDDYDSEYRHVNRPLEPLHTLDRAGRVIYIGTFSKVLSPSLRLGYAVLPDALVGPAINLRRLMDCQPNHIIQQAMHRFMADGHFERHLRRTRKIYSERHDLATAFVAEQVVNGTLHRIGTSNAGLHVTAHLPTGVDEHATIARLRARDVIVGSYYDCWISNNPQPGLIVGFGNTNTDDLPSALQIIGDVLQDQPRRVRPRRAPNRASR